MRIVGNINPLYPDRNGIQSSWFLSDKKTENQQNPLKKKDDNKQRTQPTCETKCDVIYNSRYECEGVKLGKKGRL